MTLRPHPLSNSRHLFALAEAEALESFVARIGELIMKRKLRVATQRCPQAQRSRGNGVEQDWERRVSSSQTPTTQNSGALFPCSIFKYI